MERRKFISFIPQQYLAVTAVLAAIMMGVLDGTIMNVALPTLSQEFETSPSDIIWVVNAYQLVVTMMLLSFAAMGDVFGYRRIFLTGVSIFVVASIACALSTSFEMLVAARILQGIGGACTMSINTALLRLIFPPNRLGRVMGINAVVVAVTAASGPTLGGLILSLSDWNWIFILNVPIGLTALFIGWKLLPHNPASTVKRHLDKISVLGNALTFGLLIYTIEAFAHQESYSSIILQTGLLVVIGTFYIRRQHRIDTPILPVDLFRIPIFSMSIANSIACFTAQMLALVSIPFFFQNNLGLSAIQTGLLITPWPLASSLTAPLAGRLIERIHPGVLGGIGMGIFTTGLFMLYLLPSDAEIWNIIWRMALCGIGIGLFQTPNNVTITTSAPIQRSGGASGMLGTARVLGQTLGTALVALLFQIIAEDKASQSCLMLAIIFATAACIVSFLRTKEDSPIQKA